MLTPREARRARAIVSLVALLAAGSAARAGSAEGALTAQQVRNARIAGVYDQPVALQDGRFEGPPLVAGGAARPTLTLLPDLVAPGRLSGSGAEEAAALLAENSGGSGERIYLAVLALRGGAAESVGTVLVGDRTRIVTLEVAAAEVRMLVVETGPGEPACCPTRIARKTFGFEGGTLVLKNSVAEGALSLALAEGAEWTAVAIDGEPLPAGTPPTAVVTAGRVAGFSGCNRYTAPVRESAPGQIAVGPAAGTKMACPDPQMQLEARFLARLGSATRYDFVAGRLVLSGMEEGSPRSVWFVRGTPP